MFNVDVTVGCSKENMDYLSGEDLVIRNKEAQKQAAPVVARSLKKKHPDGSTEAKLSIAKLQDDLLQMLSQERIERTVVRSQATFEFDEYGDPLIVVTRKMGKWNQFGFNSRVGFCLAEHETLFLIEMNRLELYFNSVIVSLEQAYELLLGENLSATAYFIYAQLMRVGYNVEFHDSTFDSDSKLKCEQPAVREFSTITEECIWRCLFENLNTQPVQQNSNIAHAEIFAKTKQSMLEIAALTKDPLRGDVENEILQQENFIDTYNSQEAVEMWRGKMTGKRKISDAVKTFIPNKKFKLAPKEPEPSSSSCQPEEDTFFLDLLLPDITEEFQSIFKKIQIIQLLPIDLSTTEDVEDLQYDFDLYAANSNYSKAEPGIPIYRILVIESGQTLPSTLAIGKCYLRQNLRVPIMVIFMNDTMAMHSLIYKVSV